MSLNDLLLNVVPHNVEVTKRKHHITLITVMQCCGSEIRCLFDPWIRNEFFPDPGLRFRIPNPYGKMEKMEKILIRDGKKSDRGSGKTSRIRTTASKTLFLFQ
jgi:hypothetical protein